MKPNRFTTINLILFLVLKSSALAQSDFRNGYMITLQSDTINGEIDNRNYHDNSQFCDFKKLNSDSVKRYYPDQLSGYRFESGKYYISKIIGNKRIFMEYLINGKLNIYFYQDEKANNHYYASKDSSRLVELKYDKGIVNVNGKDMFYESKNFVGPLTYMTNDCPSIRNKIPAMSGLSHDKLIHLAKEYHDLICKDEECIVYEKKMPSKILLNMYGGINTFSPSSSDVARKTFPSFGFTVFFSRLRIVRGFISVLDFTMME